MGLDAASIAVLRGGAAEVVPNSEGQRSTPAYVWLRGGRLMVGRRAWERRFEDSENVHGEFMFRMGLSEDLVFKSGGRRMKPEELAAELLKSLLADAKQRTGEDVTSAAITVPADFDLPQNHAVLQAAALAGLKRSPLVQEPLALAEDLRRGSAAGNPRWLLCSVGESTTEATLLEAREDGTEILNHGGDAQLGARLLDWALVDAILAPVAARQNALADFRRENPLWVRAFARIKHRAGDALRGAWPADEKYIYVDPLCPDGPGGDCVLEYELRRAEVERLADPFLDRVNRLCRRVATEQGRRLDEIGRFVLLGSMAGAPYWRQRLVDPLRGGLGIPIDVVTDACSALARGAALFAGAQKN